MELSKSSNPVLHEKIYNKAYQGEATEVMTVNGTVNKIAFLMLFLFVGAYYTWRMAANSLLSGELDSSIVTWVFAGGIGGFILALTTTFKPEWSPYTAPFYALFEGLFLGAISAMMNFYYPGIVMQAVGLTFATLFAMLFCYKTNLIRATEKFKTGVIIATGGIAVFYLVTWILSWFGVYSSLYYGSGIVSIGISLVIVVIAALNLILDFDFIEKGAERGAPRYMEWYGAFGLMVTLVWLYVELLRLLSKISGRN